MKNKFKPKFLDIPILFYDELTDRICIVHDNFSECYCEDLVAKKQGKEWQYWYILGDLEDDLFKGLKDYLHDDRYTLIGLVY